MVARRCGRALSNKLRGELQEATTRLDDKKQEMQKHDSLTVEKNNESSVLARSDGHPSGQDKCADGQASKDKVDFPKDSFVVQLPPGTPGVTRMTRVHVEGDNSTAAGVANQTARPEAQAQEVAEKDGVKETAQGARDEYPGGSDAVAPDAQPLLPTQTDSFLRASAGGAHQVEVPCTVIGAARENGKESKSKAQVGMGVRMGTALKGTAKDPDDSGEGQAGSYWNIRMQVSEQDVKKYMAGNQESTLTGLDYSYWSKDTSVSEEELSSFGKHPQETGQGTKKNMSGLKSELHSRNDDDGAQGHRHHHGQHAAVRGSALVPIHSNQGHVMGGVTQKNDHGTQGSTTSMKERNAAEVNMNRELRDHTHVLASSGTFGDLGDGRSNPVGETLCVVAAGDGSSGTSVEKGPRSPFMDSEDKGSGDTQDGMYLGTIGIRDTHQSPFSDTGDKDAATPMQRLPPFLVVAAVKDVPGQSADKEKDPNKNAGTSGVAREHMLKGNQLQYTERVNTVTTGRRERSQSADKVKQQVAATPATVGAGRTDVDEEEDQDVKPVVDQRRATVMEPVYGEANRTLGFRPDYKEGKFYNLGKALEKRMTLENLSLKKDFGARNQETLNKASTTANRLKVLQAMVREQQGVITAQENRIKSLETQMEGLTRVLPGLIALANEVKTIKNRQGIMDEALDYQYVKIADLCDYCQIAMHTGNTPEGSIRQEEVQEPGMEGVYDELLNWDGGNAGDMENSQDNPQAREMPRMEDGFNTHQPSPAPQQQNTVMEEEDVQVLSMNVSRREEPEPVEGGEYTEKDGTTPEHVATVVNTLGVTENGMGGETQEQLQEQAQAKAQEETQVLENGAGDKQVEEEGNPRVETATQELPKVTDNSEVNPQEEDQGANLFTIANSQTMSQVPVRPQEPPTETYRPPQVRELCNTVSQNTWRETFEGKANESVERFLRSFDTFCELNEVPEQQLCKQLWLHLKGYAQEVVMDMPDKDKADYLAMKVRLKEMFGKGDQTHDARAKIEDLRYTPGTRVMEFIGEVMMLLKKANPGYSLEMLNETAYNVVKAKLPEELQMEIVRVGVDNLEGLKVAVPRIEELARISGRKSGMGMRRQAQMVNATYMDQEQTNVGIVGSNLNAPDAPRPSRSDQVTPARYKPNRQGANRVQTQRGIPQATQGFRRQQAPIQRNQSFGNGNYGRQGRQQGTPVCGYCERSGHGMINCWRNPQGAHYRPGFGEVRQQPMHVQPIQRQPMVQQRQPVAYQPLPQIAYQPEQRMPNDGKCFKCGNVGHISRNCPMNRTQPKQQGGTDQGGTIDMLVKALAQSLHINNQGGGRVNQVTDQTTPQGPTVQHPPSTVSTVVQIPSSQATDKAQVKQPKVYSQEDIKALEESVTMLKNQFFLKKDREEPPTDLVTTLTRQEVGQPEYVPPDFRMVILPVKVNGSRIAGLLDTGSSVTLGSTSLASALNIETEPSDKSIKSMTGHTESAPRKATIELTLAGHKRMVVIHFTADSVWMGNPYDVIIGGDTMQEFPKYTVDTGKREFSMGTNSISWKTKAEIMLEERKVFLVQDVTVPPGHEMLVNAVIDKSKGKVNELVTVVQFGEQKLQVIEALTEVDEDCRCKILIANPTDSPISARKFTVVGKACNVIEDKTVPQEYPEITASTVEAFKCAKKDTMDPTFVVDYSKCDCSEEQKGRLRELLEKYSDQFSKNGYDLGMAKVNPMQIRTTTEEPYRPSIYNADRGMRDKVNEELEKMREMGCIRESNTPWLSPLVMVKKKNGELRPCIDLRKLNAITIPDYYPLPRVSDALDRVGNSFWMTSLDLNKGFWQLPLSEDASWKCGVISNDRVYQCLTMPFGLRNAPSAFMRAMRTILGPLWDKCVVYIDDIVIMTREDDFEQHLKDIAAVLERFKEFNVKANPKKCDFARRQITFLGHSISKDGYKPDERNVVKIKELPVPKSQQDVRHCIGVFSFFRRLIKDFARIASPLTALCGKNVKFAWNEECQKAFETLKDRLTSEPTLAFPDDSQEYHLMVDASTKAIGVALMQKQGGVWRPISFYSRALSKAEQKRPAVQLELMAIVEGLRWCRYFTYGKKVVVHTDHRPLLHLMQKKETHVNLARWLIELQQYDNVTIQHVDGKRNTVADALSRWEELTQGRPVRELQDEVQGAFGLDTDGDRQVEKDACNTVWVMRGKTVKDYQIEDKVLSQAIKAIQDKVDPTTIGDAELKWYVEKCELNEKGTLVLKEHGEQQGRKVIVPKAFQRLVFDQFHGSKVGGGHTNARTTQEKMREFAWRGMPRDVAEWHKRCYQCQIRAPKRMKVPPVMTRLQRPFEKMGLDVCGPLHATSSGMLHYLTCIDEFTKYVVTVAIPDTKCLTIARALWEQVILKYGCPQEITTDNAKTFSADLFKWMMEQMGIKHVFCTPHHSDGNAITERSFRTYHDMIAKYAETWEPQEEKKEWDRMLPIATFAYNVTRHSTTAETPYMLMHGRDPIFPIHLTLQDDSKPRETMSIKDFRAELVKMVELVQKQALEAFDRAANRIKAQADKHCKELDISEGELVLYRDYSLRVGMSTKFKNPWKDVYRVRKLVNQHAWIVPSTSPNDAPKKVHLNQIKRFYPDLEEGEEQTHEEAVDRPQEQRKVIKAGSGWREKKQERKKEYERHVEAKAQAEEKVQKRRGEGTKYNLRQNVRRKDAAEASS